MDYLKLLCVIGLVAQFFIVRCEDIIYRNIKIPTNISSFDTQRCQIIEHHGPYKRILELKQIKQRKRRLYSQIEPGGRFEPKCRALQEMAIVVPYRNRPRQLEIFIYNLHEMLTKQNISKYQLFVVEQDDHEQFNRAKLLNIGFYEALQFRSFECFIFHDVELIPIDYNNIYLCSSQPRHMSYNIETFTNFYENLFGGVCAIMSRIFLDVNGFSNNFFGWGGEDDEMRSRLIRKGYHIERLPYEMSRYLKLPHGKEKLNDPNDKRFEMIKNSWRTSIVDGLNSLSYKLISIVTLPLYTLITVDLSD